MRPWLAGVATLAAGVALLAGPGSARADFTESFCQGGAPAAPWGPGAGTSPGFAGTLDRCASGQGFGFLLPNSAMAPGEVHGATVAIPSGEALTHVAMDYDTVAGAGGNDDFDIGYDQTFLVYGFAGDSNVGTSVDAPVPDATSLSVGLFCANTSGCGFGTQDVITAGAMTLTLHDTGAPAVQATGGALSARGTVRGTTTLGYAATDGGSGVARVTVSLGRVVVANLASSCQPSSLRPCPPAASGVASVDTRAVPDGTYPVTLTAYDMSGDPTTVQVSTVTVRNHSGTQTLLTRAPRGVHTRLAIDWRWTTRQTTLTGLHVRRLDRRATVTFACRGRHCPFRRMSTDERHLARFERRLRGTRFRVGQRLTVTVSEPHRRAEHATLVVRRGREPRVLR